MDQSYKDKIMYKGDNPMCALLVRKKPIINVPELNMHNTGMLRTIEDHIMYSTMQVSAQVIP